MEDPESRVVFKIDKTCSPSGTSANGLIAVCCACALFNCFTSAAFTGKKRPQIEYLKYRQLKNHRNRHLFFSL